MADVYGPRTLTALILSRRMAAVVVVGTLLSGMSTRVVTPPAAAARVALAAPATHSRNGSCFVSSLCPTTFISLIFGGATATCRRSRRAGCAGGRWTARLMGTAFRGTCSQGFSNHILDVLRAGACQKRRWHGVDSRHAGRGPASGI